MTSRIKGFYLLSVEERVKLIAEKSKLTNEEVEALNSGISLELADAMVENVIGHISIPLGVAANFKVNGKEVFIPMATEEPSVIAAASNAARAAYELGGIFTSSSGTVMRGQIQVLNIDDPHAARAKIFEHKDEIIEHCNAKDPTLVKLGGGVKDVEVHLIDTAKETMVVVHLIVDTKDAMGANAVNTMAESVSPLIERITNGRVVLRIISNLADKRIVRARGEFSTEMLGGIAIAKNIVSAYEFADSDPYRAATHNKGVMNGITAAVLASGNDTRAVEAGAHAYAARSGRYRSLTTWELNKAGNLVGTLELPLAVGIVGGATKTHPVAKAALKIMDVQSAEELASYIAAVGLVENLASLRALSAEGIQSGHMRLHAKNLAVMAGATGDIIDRVVQQAVEEKDFRYDRVLEITNSLRGE
ncbi:hydroxymethylglutaryl-CoA reductase, degradative [Lysinibacillus fusiformis]|uniref:hydroxymethylglutaryl-CoA reductase, degradative n=1 Tax=Lysinibacillus fusiformis TaxID=28031 RepID=UPI0008E4AB75|nr:MULTISPECIES: hydroxymethylglutaryl-CoA reductase, degradative [Lysinibacillus]MCG7436018.1 hydroxymethylglutaryl-CoA reductase, degradative [Lysinibacillus fusiformis]MED4669846.1 hydroxymethylglutaryl-CoA reductase, degradative [Lysinibacillus fusiformis]NOG26088.1 hydroxymethylglutaryl-CoA reductase, degradative [Lysinibacillus fusiformis]PCD85176.1 hydroxymethylglutaryl-CoA reductase, degradative [Lysinibacillus fusiformis]QAS59166.1 hydroxymethylglutaryl-CoA reductase, degradative [Lys